MTSEISKNYEGAFTWFTRAIEKGETKPEVMKNFVNLCIESSTELAKAGDWARAAERVGIALKYDPSSIEAMMNLAYFSINTGNNQKAVGLWRQVILVNPSEKLALKNLALYYTKNRYIKDSASYFTEQFVRNGGKVGEIR